MVKGYEEMIQRSNSNINKHVKRCLISLIVRQIRMKVIVRYNFCYKTSKNLKERELLPMVETLGEGPLYVVKGNVSHMFLETIG